MTDFDSATLLLSGAVFLLAGLVKGVTGMGLPTVAMGVLVLRERLRRLQWLALGLAAVAVVLLTVSKRDVPAG